MAMTKLISLDKDYTIKLKSQITKYLSPEFIYIPITSKRVAKKKSVLKGELVFADSVSSVSGKMLGLEICDLPSGKKLECVKIANDFQERAKETSIRRMINRLSKEEVLASIYDESLKEKIKKENVKTILISGIDDEPYLANEVFVQKKYTKNLLEVIDTLLHLNPESKAIIAIKTTDSENIMAYQSFLGTYQNIDLRLVEDLYLIGQEQFLVEAMHVNNDYLYLKASEVYTLYTNLKKRKPETEKLVTFTGNGILEPQVMEVKIGTKVLAIFKNFYSEDLKNIDVYANGIMRGKKVSIENMIVTEDLNGLVFMKKEKYKEYDCIKCGKCIQVCPIKSNPMLALKNGKKIRCIDCGLCSYICPSYIPLHKYVSGDSFE